jgi:HAD superfamily hydrolase (TIGR01549 family)
MVEKPLLLFDMDGTLISLRMHSGSSRPHVLSSVKQQMKEIAVSYGIPMEEYHNLNRMSHIWNKTRTYAKSHGFNEMKIMDLMNAINEPFTREESADHSKSILIPGTIEALTDLENKGYSLGMVTTASRGAYERVSNNPEFGCFKKFFQYSITRDDCKYLKPNPEPIYRILELFGRSDFVYVGDSDHDAHAVNAAGGEFILLNTRRYNDETLFLLDVKVVIESLLELPRLLESYQ